MRTFMISHYAQSLSDAALRDELKAVIDAWLDTIPVTSLALPDEEEVLDLVSALTKYLASGR